MRRLVRPQCSRSAARLGFTLVELLVVIAIIGVLVALLLPAIQASREAARRSSCSNNLKQLGLALQNYHDARKTFPYAAVINTLTVGLSTSQQGPSWVVAILPFIEAGNVLTLYNKNAFWMDDGSNSSFRAATLPFMICPSDAFAAVPFNGTGVSTVLGPIGNWARGCYGANVSPYWLCPTSVASWTGMINGKGVMSTNTSLSMKQVLDGTSKTIALVEFRADPSPGAARGVWGLPSGASAAYGHGASSASPTYPDIGPNNPGNPTGAITGSGQDYVENCGSGFTQAQLYALGMGCGGNGETNTIGPKSQHTSGLQYVFCDGSVHWMNDDIQIGITTSTAANIQNGYYEMLFLSQDGATIPQDVYNN